MGKFKDLQCLGQSPYALVESEYLRWLCEIIAVDKMPSEYWQLTKLLHEISFEWDILQDENRCQDGARLRSQFREETGNEHKEDFSEPCTVLEVMVSLAMRMEFQLWQLGAHDRTADRFWELIDNLGLMRFDDEEYFLSQGKSYITNVIQDMMDRNYQRNGTGGLFPLKRSRKDQRKTELWYQMMEYLMENYDIADDSM